MYYIAFDAHKRYTLASVEKQEGGKPQETRIEHRPGEIRRFLRDFPPATPVAVETIGNWYWIVDEIESAGMEPRLVHALKAKLMMGQINKTDKLDARGMNKLQRTGALPTTWIPTKEVRDRRELLRTRMTLTAERTKLKNRIQSTLAKYGLSVEGVSDVFGKKGRRELEGRLPMLPLQTRYATERLLEQLDLVMRQVSEMEKRVKELLGPTEELELVRTLPCVGLILGAVIVTEVGDIGRFAEPERLASYSGTTPRVHSSGGKTRYGRLRPDVNRYLKWAYIEAANMISAQRRRWPDRKVVKIYERLRAKKGHQKAVGAVARHLAEATYWVLTRREAYQPQVSSTKGEPRR